jgi:hypothetical protein
MILEGKDRKIKKHKEGIENYSLKTHDSKKNIKKHRLN